MSSDESDHSAGHGETVYRIRRKTWRSTKLTQLLRTLDALHLRVRYGNGFDASPGAWPHFRIISDSESTKRVVSGLPSCCYQGSWFTKCNSFELSEINASKRGYNLELRETVMQCVFYYFIYA